MARAQARAPCADRLVNMTSLALSELLLHAAGLVQSVQSGRSLSDLLPKLPEAARPGAQALAFEVLRRLAAARAAREALAPKAPKPDIDALLQSALALLWPQEQPAYSDFTVVDQAVAAVKKKSPTAAGFVNAVLRRFVRERAALAPALEAQAAVRWNHPPWWIESLQRDWPDPWADLLAHANHKPPMALRVNARQTNAAQYAQELAAQGHAATVCGPHSLVLAQACPVQALPGFAQGRVSVQDLAAQRAAPLLIGAGLPTQARVLDACAAPGGKTAHLLELADLNLLALDSDAKRLARVQETLARLQLTAQLKAADARHPKAWWDGQPFDAILLDAPCSASGIVRRHPDIRWLRRPEDIAALAHTQAELLDALWPLLHPGGRLVYATCSVFKAEGQAQIDAFLQRQGLHKVQVSANSPGHCLPLPHNGLATPDGFFYAVLQKPQPSTEPPFSLPA
jgi:16S rRNA (cytosine967-C5)-methyltransferase